MLNAMTAEARTALRVAHRVTLTVGRTEIDGLAMVAAMLAEPDGVAARALARFAVTDRQLLERAGLAVEPVPPPIERRTPFAPEVRAALETVARDVLGNGRIQITSADILLGLIAQDGPAARTLAELGATPDLIRAAVAETAPPPASLPGPVATMSLPAPPEPPRAWYRLARFGGLAMAYLVAFGVAVLVLPVDERLVVLVGYVAIALIEGVAQVVLTGVGARRVRRRLDRRAPTTIAAPAVITDLVRRAGVRRFELRVSPGRLIHDRAYRMGRSAYVVLSAVTIVESVSLPFVLAHEIGHVVRRDSGHHRASFVLAASMAVIPIAAPAPVPFAVAFLAAATVFVADRWLAEYACDAVAVRWVGVDPLRVWMATYASRLRRPENRTRRRRLRRMVGRLTHPPIAWRVARAERLAQALSQRSRPGRTPERRQLPWPRRSPATPADPDAGSSRTRRASG